MIVLLTLMLAIAGITFSVCADDTRPEATMRFENAPLSVMLETYQKKSGKEVLIRAGVHATFSFQGRGDLIKTIERLLDEKGIILVPEGNNRLIAEWHKNRD
jgi:hypothetical protein